MMVVVWLMACAPDGNTKLNLQAKEDRGAPSIFLSHFEEVITSESGI